MLSVNRKTCKINITNSYLCNMLMHHRLLPDKSIQSHTNTNKTCIHMCIHTQTDSESVITLIHVHMTKWI